MKNAFRLFLLISIISLVGCGRSPQPSRSTVSNTPPVSPPSGEKLWERNCISCHGAGSLSAPRLAEISSVYEATKLPEAEFVQSMTGFIKNPSRASAKMPEAIEKYGMMPKLSIPEKDYATIAKYVYQQANDGHSEAAPSTINPDGSINYLMQGKEFALKTKAVLSKNLLGSIEKKGTAGAVTFCNTQAYPLTDSVAKVLKAKIRRVSDQPRNPKNQASSSEIRTIKKLKAVLAADGTPKPSFQETEKKFTGYYPIATNNMCLQCHGKTGDDIAPETASKLASLYPKDKATGYGKNELRGIWVVEMDK